VSSLSNIFAIYRYFRLCAKTKTTGVILWHPNATYTYQNWQIGHISSQLHKKIIINYDTQVLIFNAVEEICFYTFINYKIVRE
jgi:hypothetical protein